MAAVQPMIRFLLALFAGLVACSALAFLIAGVLALTGSETPDWTLIPWAAVGVVTAGVVWYLDPADEC